MRRELIEAVVRELAAIDRPSASEGERHAAGLIVERLRALGCRDVRVESERAHGGYWWPLALPNLAAALSAWPLARRPRSRTRRILAALAGAAGAAAVYDDVGGGRLWLRRALLPHRETFNVVAETGDPQAERTLVFVAHHDAAHSGLVFHPALAAIGPKRFPEAHARSSRALPIMYGTFLGPALTALAGLAGRRSLAVAGVLFGAGAGATMADVARSEVVPGANDNLSSVGVLAALATAFAEEPLGGLRVLLVSTGSEESFMEGMQGFGRRHFPALPRATTEFVCLECVGSPTLHVLEGEGMLVMRRYPAEAREALAAAAASAGAEAVRGLHTIAATDALIPLRAGYRTSTLTAVDERKFPSNYHWPTDVPDNLSWETIERAAEVCERLARDRAAAEA